MIWQKAFGQEFSPARTFDTKKPGFLTVSADCNRSIFVKKPGFLVPKVHLGQFPLLNAFYPITIAFQLPPASADFRLESALLSPFPQQLIVDR